VPSLHVRSDTSTAKKRVDTVVTKLQEARQEADRGNRRSQKSEARQAAERRRKLQSTQLSGRLTRHILDSLVSWLACRRLIGGVAIVAGSVTVAVTAPRRLFAGLTIPRFLIRITVKI